jgi:hypothetical protein
VHSGRQRWQLFDLVAEAQRRGWTACDYTVVQNASAARSNPKHKTQYHVRNQCAFWLVLRNGPACHGARATSQARADVCGVRQTPSRRGDRMPRRTTAPAARRSIAGALVALDDSDVTAALRYAG